MSDPQSQLAAPASPPNLLLAAMVAAGPIAMSIYVPALPLIGADLGAAEHQVELTVTLYFIVFAVGQLLIGPMSDSWGRKRMALIGITAYAIGGLTSALAPDITVLMAGRMVQAFGGAAGVVLARTILKDVHDGDRMAQALARVVMISAIAPIIAPAVGGFISEHYGWRSTLFLLVALSLVIMTAIVFKLPETAPKDDADRSFSGYLKVYLGLLRNVPFLSYNVHASLFSVTYFGFLTGMPLILTATIGLGTAAFGAWYTVIPVSYLLGNALASRMVRLTGMRRVLFFGTFISTGGVAVMVALSIVLTPSAPIFFIPAMAMAFGHGMGMPNVTALAMTHVPTRAGTAVAAMGAVQMTSASIGSAIVSAFDGSTAWPVLITMMLAQGAASLMVVRSVLRGHSWR
ncbi:multidrug effflux MFS transporter [Actibacterium sp.]|uniref:multidrug effflux MFS transporter n=1 Tax=Actibacterium sp. TaxID=1872125 RepID=UPI0035676A75